jgi:PAP2 superfamily C-terminal
VLKTWQRVGVSFVARVVLSAGGLWLALLAEGRAAPTLFDAVLDVTPYVTWLARYNYLLWLAAYVPVSLWFLKTDAERFIRYMYLAGTVAFLRGVCIVVTGLGPIYGPDQHVGLTLAQRTHAFWDLLNPFAFFAPSAGARLYLTKDLFFSGHTSSTFLLLLYVWPYRWLRWWMLTGHVLVVASVFFSHLHYTIDVIGAYAVTFSLFALREWRPKTAT